MTPKSGVGLKVACRTKVSSGPRDFTASTISLKDSSFFRGKGRTTSTIGRLPITIISSLRPIRYDGREHRLRPFVQSRHPAVKGVEEGIGRVEGKGEV